MTLGKQEIERSAPIVRSFPFSHGGILGSNIPMIEVATFRLNLLKSIEPIVYPLLSNLRWVQWGPEVQTGSETFLQEEERGMKKDVAQGSRQMHWALRKSHGKLKKTVYQKRLYVTWPYVIFVQYWVTCTAGRSSSNLSVAGS